MAQKLSRQMRKAEERKEEAKISREYRRTLWAATLVAAIMGSTSIGTIVFELQSEKRAAKLAYQMQQEEERKKEETIQSNLRRLSDLWKPCQNEEGILIDKEFFNRYNFFKWKHSQNPDNDALRNSVFAIEKEHFKKFNRESIPENYTPEVFSFIWGNAFEKADIVQPFEVAKYIGFNVDYPAFKDLEQRLTNPSTDKVQQILSTALKEAHKRMTYCPSQSNNIQEFEKNLFYKRGDCEDFSMFVANLYYFSCINFDKRDLIERIRIAHGRIIELNREKRLNHTWIEYKQGEEWKTLDAHVNPDAIKPEPGIITALSEYGLPTETTTDAFSLREISYRLKVLPDRSMVGAFYAHTIPKQD